MSQATGPISKIGCSPLIIAAAVAVVAAIVGGFFLFASPSTEESTSVDPCLAEGNVFVREVDAEAIEGIERIDGVLHVSTQLMDEQDGCVDPWPLTTTSGELVCLDNGLGSEVFWSTLSDADVERWYGVNDAALAWADFDINLIRKDAPEGSAGLKVDLEPLLKLGLSLCGNPDLIIAERGEGDYGPCLTESNFLRMDEQDGCVDPWPLTTTSGKLTCFEEGTTITSPSTVGAFRIVWDTYEYTDVGDRPKWYALNDAAIAAAPVFNFLDIDLIRKDDPDGIDGSKVDLEPLLKLGLSLCEIFLQ